MDPKVVISDRMPPVVQCRDGAEEAACLALLQQIRRGNEPMVIVYRKPDGSVHVTARSSMFAGPQGAEAVMREATTRLARSLFGRTK